MAIFHSYVKLPEGIIFTASASHGCPPRSTTIVLQHRAWHRFTLQLPPQHIVSSCWMLQHATGDHPGLCDHQKRMGCADCSCSSRSEWSSQIGLISEVYEKQLRLKCHFLKVLETSWNAERAFPLFPGLLYIFLHVIAFWMYKFPTLSLPSIQHGN